MTDHLEPYRRMVRSIRFVPALGPTHQSQQPVMPLPQVNLSPSVPSAPPPASEVAPDPSEHVTALVREAVSKPTVLPVTYAIAENLGDRISRLAAAKPTRSQPPEIIAFKIPQPDPNWKPAPPVPGWEQPVEASSTAPSAVAAPEVESPSSSVPEREAQTPVAAPEVESPSSSVPEREAAPLPEPVEETPSALPEAISEAPTAAPEVSAQPAEETPVAEAGSPEEAIAPIEKSEDKETQQPPTAPKVPAQPIEETTAAEAESPEAIAPIEEPEDTQEPSLLDRAAAALQAVVSVFDQPDAEQKEPAVEPAAPEVEAETSAATPAPVEEIPSQSEVETETPTAEAPESAQPAEETAAESSEEAIAPNDADAPQPTLLDRAASALEAVVSVFNQQPEADDQNEPAVESAPAAAPEAPEMETPQIICPKCGAPEVRKNGHYKNKQRYVCKDCGKQFVAADAVEDAESQTQTKTSVTPEAQESPKTEKTDSVPAVPEKASKGKGKKPAKGFGRPKTK